MTSHTDDAALPASDDPLNLVMASLLDGSADAHELLVGRVWTAAFREVLDEVDARIDERVRQHIAGYHPNRKQEVAASETATRAIMTNPDAQPIVTDEKALAEWIKAQDPDQLPEGAVVLERDELDVEALKRAVEESPALLNQIAFLVPEASVRRTYLGEKAAAGLARMWGKYEGKGNRRHVAAGALVADVVDPKTGELRREPIPGVEMRFKSEPKLRVTIDKAEATRIAHEFIARHLPVMAEAGGGREET